MKRREEAIHYLKQGLCRSKIAEKMRVSFKTIEQYLSWGIGEGLILRSDIVYTIDIKKREIIETIINKLNTDYWFTIYQELSDRGEDIERDDLQIYLKYRKFVREPVNMEKIILNWYGCYGVKESIP